ncbi:MAG: 2-C-methyl-D-erythritol 4-phosphate cytidylyltransferase, partial [Tepidanaerobacteraceae bacterium]|nr:2-C-methyl-D-erythritol 4-phosphate cytidylyltransferase [Tepidanaerobacteraceae bacterium]
MQIGAVIAAGGQGKRMNSNISKQFLTIRGHPILYYTLNKFEKMDIIKSIVLVTSKHDMGYTNEEIIKRYGFKKIKMVEGGKERQDSVYSGLRGISSQTDIVVIHDGVRPFVSTTLIEKSINAAIRYKAVGVAVPVKDTIKVVGNGNIIKNTPNRKTLWAMQTPQCFNYALSLEAYEKARCEG